MRLFDAIGIVAVTGWLALTGVYVWEHEFDTAQQASAPDGELQMSDGDTWLILRRNEEDIGFVHQTRTRLSEGWLVEYEMVMLAEILQRTFPLSTDVKAELDAQAYLEEFTAELDVVGKTFDARGVVRDQSVELTVNTGESTRRRTVELDDRPRLATNSVHQLLGQPELAPGDTFEQSYFNATSLGMRSITMEYVGREQVEVLGASHRAHHIRQTVAGRTLDLYVDADGEVLIQEFPLDIVGARVAPELGRARASTLRQKATAVDTELPDRLGAGLESALDLMGFEKDSILPSLPDPPPAGTSDDAGPTGSAPDAAP